MFLQPITKPNDCTAIMIISSDFLALERGFPGDRLPTYLLDFATQIANSHVKGRTTSSKRVCGTWTGKFLSFWRYRVEYSPDKAAGTMQICKLLHANGTSEISRLFCLSDPGYLPARRYVCLLITIPEVIT